MFLQILSYGELVLSLMKKKSEANNKIIAQNKANKHVMHTIILQHFNDIRRHSLNKNES